MYTGLVTFLELIELGKQQYCSHLQLRFKLLGHFQVMSSFLKKRGRVWFLWKLKGSQIDQFRHATITALVDLWSSRAYLAFRSPETFVISFGLEILAMNLLF